MRLMPNLHPLSRASLLPHIKITPFHSFAITIMLITLGDALIAYTAPIYLENKFHNTFIMGLIMATSSTVGLIFDFIASKKLRRKNYKYFMHLTFIFAILFPLTILFLPARFVFITMAMSFWGIYYETKIFAEFHYIDKHVPKNEYAKSWGLLSVLNAAAYFLGPLIATLIISGVVELSFSASLIIFVLNYLAFSLLNPKSRRQKVVEDSRGESKPTLKQTIKIWETLMGKIWPLWFFTFVVTLVDAAFWSVGIIFAESMREVHRAGGLILTAYMFPPIFMGLILPKITARLGKKRTAFTSALVAALFLILFGLSSDVYLLILLVLISSVFLSISTPALYAAYEDYVSRLGKFNNDMVALGQSAGSIGYIIGPPLAGGIAAAWGNHNTFIFSGILLLSTSIMCLLVVPRKIKMPQKELTNALY